MVKAFNKIYHYYSVLGLSGVAAFIFAKMCGKQLVFKKNMPGIKFPICLRIATTDASVCKQVFMEQHYNFSLPAKPKVIVDAGANIGFSAVFFANKYPDAIIIALEPEESNFKLLKKNVSPYAQIIPLNGALWKDNSLLCLIDPRHGHHGFQTAEKIDDGCLGMGFVQAMTLDSLMNRMDLEFVDILKIDIEGAEKEVFESSLKWINKVGVIMAELHDNIKPGCSNAFLMATKGFHGEHSKGEIVIRFGNIAAS